jgi:hypothetical protein
MAAKSATRKTRTIVKYSFKQLIEKRQADLEEMRIKTEQVMELRNLISQTIEDENHANTFSSSEFQKRVPVLSEEERTIVKQKILFLIQKYFK